MTTLTANSNINSVKGDNKKISPPHRKVLIMATEKKNTITNAQAMATLAEIVREMTDDQVVDYLTDDELVPVFREKIDHMAKVAQPKARKSEESAVAKVNKAKAVECEKIILAANKPVDWKYIAERCNGITSSQKATAILAYAISNGNIERVQIKGKVYYQQAGLSSIEE